MATTNFGVNHPLAVKVWAKKLFQDALAETFASRFMGTSDSALLQQKSELSKGPGDQITVGLRMQLSGTGIQGDGTLEGNEEALSLYNDAVVINQVRHAVRSGGKMSEQRVPFSVREEARTGLADWWADKIDTWFLNQLAGNTAETNTINSGNNAVTAPSTKVTPSHMATGEQSISTTDLMHLNKIDYAIEKAQLATNIIRPIKMGGDEFYVSIMHPINATDLRTNTSTGMWMDIQKSALQSGQRFADNPIWTGALGVYNNTIMHVSRRVPLGVNSSDAQVANSRRVIFAGAQAGIFAYGQDSEGGEMTWVEELFDYGNQLGVSAGLIGGLKKSRFNSNDFGVIVIPTYAAAH